jgi:hypothetical protein
MPAADSLGNYRTPTYHAPAPHPTRQTAANLLEFPPGKTSQSPICETNAVGVELLAVNRWSCVLACLNSAQRVHQRIITRSPGLMDRGLTSNR